MDLYQELILEHARYPQHAGLREPYDAEASQVNPTCGDGITLRVRLDRTAPGATGTTSATVLDVSYDVQGCAISSAATSVLAQEVIGRSVPEALHTYQAMQAMLSSRGRDGGDPQVIGDGVAFAGVAKYPARVRCALLGWTAFAEALLRAGAVPADTDQRPGAPARASRASYPKESP